MNRAMHEAAHRSVAQVRQAAVLLADGWPVCRVTELCNPTARLWMATHPREMAVLVAAARSEPEPLSDPRD